MKKYLKGCLIILIIIAIILTVAFFFLKSYYQKTINETNSSSSETVQITIAEGESARSIAQRLKESDVINNADIFFIYTKLNKIGPKIQAGNFEIPKNLNMIQVAETIQKAAGNDMWITIPEGLRSDEIAALLEQKFLKIEGSNFNKEDFLDIINNPDEYNLNSDFINKYKPSGKPLEGFLYPDTYNVVKTISTTELIELFANTLESKIDQDTLNIIENSDYDMYETITFGSILEREAKSSEERYMISYILQTRLKTGLEDGTKLLQTDATLLYELKDWQQPITQQMKESNSPYNTYRFSGLTPTPICNPGIDSILAIANPKQNEYLYYLHGEDGKIHYAKTFEEHEKNVRCFINGNTEYC